MRGKIFMSLAWAAAAMACGVWLLVRTGAGEGTAVVVTKSHLIRAPESGRIATLEVVPYQHVEAGAVLAKIEVPLLNQEIASAQAELRSLEAQISVQEADRGRQFARDLEAARASWLRARVELERDRSDLMVAEQELGRADAPGVLVATSEVERFKSLRDAAKSAVDARVTEVDALNRNYEDALRRAGGTQSALLKTSVEAAAVYLESLRMVADANVLRAYASGIVSAPVGSQARDGRTEVIDEAFPTPGQWVQAGVPVLTVTEPTSQDAVVFVDLTRARALAPGAAVSVRGTNGGSFEATVRSVGVAVERVPLRQLQDQAIQEWGVPVTLQVMDRALTPGESLSVEF
ncbi:MAG: HlyD family efflux transporter periplasmic adaptor subunit [Pseudomonadota bacterium]|nr:HlyD family efflux transporter periplasmic adaptor subunit [Pseudomonadota bacterium]